MKNTNLDKLFNEWIKRYPKYENKFVSDGIIDEIQFNNTFPKLLFIAKEPNSPDQLSDDFREWWSGGVHDNFSYRICEWAFGLLNNFPDLNKINNDRSIYIKKIAFMNLKKIGGKSTVKYDVLTKTVNEEKEFIRKEIDIIKPDIIIGGVGHEKYWKVIFDGIEFRNSGFDIKIARYGNYKIIHYYHPSYRVPRAMSYSLLGRIFNSDGFKNL